MAESIPVDRSIDIGSDTVPEYCAPCYELSREFKPVAGYCINCDDSLCTECFTFHLRPKPFRNHKLQENPTPVSLIPKLQQKSESTPRKSDKLCSQHQGEVIQSFCSSHSQLCCLVCLAINHPSCNTDDISKLAANIKESKELKDIGKKLNDLEKGYNENLRKTGTHEIIIQKNCSNAINAMTMLLEEFNKLKIENENQAENVKNEDFKKIESIAKTSSIVIEEINKLKSKIEKAEENCDNESLFISMKQAESQIRSLEESLNKMNKDNTVRGYIFEADKKVKVLIKQLKGLGCLSFTAISSTTTSTPRTASNLEQMTLTHVKDINVKSSSDSIGSCSMFGFVLLSNSQALVADYYNKTVKLIDLNKNKVISETVLKGNPFDITRVKQNQVAVTLSAVNKVQMLTVSEKNITKGKEISVQGECRGIAYSTNDQTFVVTFISPSKVEIIKMDGTVLKSIEKDNNGAQLFSDPMCVALPSHMSEIYISDQTKHSVTLLTLNGKVKTVYKDSKLRNPAGLYVDKSGLVYIVGRIPETAMMLEPQSGEIKPLLGIEDGLEAPFGITGCDSKDTMFIGSVEKGILQMFKIV